MPEAETPLDIPEEDRPLLSRYIVVGILLIFAVALSSWAILMVTRSQGARAIPKPPEGRSFLTSTSGFTPRNFPDHAPNDVIAFWEEVERAGELYMVGVDWRDTEIVELAAKFQPNGMILVLGFQEPEEWQSSVDDFISKASYLLSTYPQIHYLAIGNEVNLLKQDHPKEFANFVSAFKEISNRLKFQYPNVRISSTFQYETLIGNGFLFGLSDEREPSVELITELEDYIDFVGLTLYPHLDFEDPASIPDDYFAPITELTDKPIGITETGWMSRMSYGGGGPLSQLRDLGLTGSEEEQVSYLSRLIQLVENLNTEFISWSFIHDFTDWAEGDEPAELAVFDSIGLKYNDGKPKQVWGKWLELVNFPE